MGVVYVPGAVQEKLERMYAMNIAMYVARKSPYIYSPLFYVNLWFCPPSE